MFLLLFLVTVVLNGVRSQRNYFSEMRYRQERLNSAIMAASLKERVAHINGFDFSIIEEKNKLVILEKGEVVLDLQEVNP